MYKEQRDRFFGKDPGDPHGYDDPTVLARRVEFPNVDKKKIVSSTIFTTIAFLLFFAVFAFLALTGGFEDDPMSLLIPLSIFFVVFLSIPILAVNSIRRGMRIVNASPIAIKQNGDFAIDLYLDNGQRMNVLLRDIAEIKILPIGSASIRAGKERFSVPPSSALIFSFKDGKKKIILRYVKEGERVKEKLDKLVADSKEDFF